MNEVIAKLQALLEDPNIKIEDFYFTERADMDTVFSIPGELEDEEWEQNWPTGVKRIFYYVKYTDLEKQKEYERR